MAMIEIDNLTKRFGPFLAVDHVSFSVDRGEVLGFLGPNGAGKSTTMKMVSGFLTPTDGTARVCGFDVQKDSLNVKRHIGYLPEGAPMWSDMTPRAFLEFIAKVRGLDGAEAVERLRTVIEQTHLDSVLEKPIDTLSKGFKRRVGLAQALIHDPDVLILDEPTDGLDPNQKFEVRNLIADMAATKAIIISTHILEEVEAVCTRAIIIANGKVVVDETPDALVARSNLHNAVSVQVNGDIGAAQNILKGLETVDGIDVRSDNRILVRPKGQETIIGDVGDALRNANIAVSEIHMERGQLDDVFRTVTTGA